MSNKHNLMVMFTFSVLDPFLQVLLKTSVGISMAFVLLPYKAVLHAFFLSFF